MSKTRTTHAFPFRRGVNASQHTGQVRRGRPFADPEMFAAGYAALIAETGFALRDSKGAGWTQTGKLVSRFFGKGK